MSLNRSFSPDTGFPDRMAGTRSRHPDAKVLAGPWEPEDPDVIFRRRLLSRSSTANLLQPTTAFSSFSRTTSAASSALTTPNRSPSLGATRPSTSSSNAAFLPFSKATPFASVPACTKHSSSKERSGSFGSTSSAGTMMSSDSAASSASRISASERSGWGAWAARIGEWNEKRKARRNASFRRLDD